jgi:hypothetical protein
MISEWLDGQNRYKFRNTRDEALDMIDKDKEMLFKKALDFRLNKFYMRVYGSRFL